MTLCKEKGALYYKGYYYYVYNYKTTKYAAVKKATTTKRAQFSVWSSHSHRYDLQIWEMSPKVALVVWNPSAGYHRAKCESSHMVSPAEGN